MPETSVHENGDAFSRENKIGTPKYRVVATPTVKPIFSKQVSKGKLSSGVALASDRRHDAGTRRRWRQRSRGLACSLFRSLSHYRQRRISRRAVLFFGTGVAANTSLSQGVIQQHYGKKRFCNRSCSYPHTRIMPPVGLYRCSIPRQINSFTSQPNR